MYQKIIIIGNLGRDPEMRYMADGTAVTNINVATSRRWTNQATGQPEEETIWFRVSLWRRQAEIANQYLTKGSRVLVEGRLRPDPATGAPRLWTRQDGTVSASYEITADNIQFLSPRTEGSGFADDQYSGTPAQEEDDIPF